ncbi:segregation and condensation protein A [Chromatium weissei]|nr:segregation and condensation protein A [Chromatium weissei]
MTELTPEQELLLLMRHTLAAIIRDVTPQPGMRHPLSNATVEEVRHCLGMIAAREQALATDGNKERPHFIDEPQPVRIPVSEIKKRGD